MDNTATRVVKADKLPEGGAETALPSTAVSKAQHVREGERSIVIPLEFPLEYDGVTYASLTAHRLNGVDLMKMKSDARSGTIANQELYLFALMCRVPVALIEALDADDLVNLMGETEDFMPRYVRRAAAQTGAPGQSSQQT